MKLKTIIGWMAVLSLCYSIYISFNINPDITIGTWLGYKFGFNLTENMPFKLVMIMLLVTYGWLATAPSDDSAGPR